MEDKRVFISYSHVDQHWADVLVRDAVQTPRGMALHKIDFRELVPGDRFDEELERQCKAASGFVLLVSRHFLSSDYVRTKEWEWIYESQGEGNGRICWIPIGGIERDDSAIELDERGEEILTKLKTLHYDVALPPRLPRRADRLEVYTLRVHESIATMLDPVGSALEQKMKQRGFEKLEWISDGELASVYTTRSPLLARKLAIKAARDDACLEPFLESLDQAQSISAIPNFYPVYEVDKIHHPPHCLMEHIEGASLGAFVEARQQENRPVEFNVAHHVLLKLALALKTAHERKLPHLNVKPSNILIDDYGEPFLSATSRSHLTVRLEKRGDPNHFEPFAHAVVATVAEFDDQVEAGLGEEDPILEAWNSVLLDGARYLARAVREQTDLLRNA